INFLGDINLQGNTVFDVKKITGYLGTWSIDEEGKLIAVKIETGELTVGSPDKPTGITIYDKKGKPGCLSVEDVETGQMKVVPGVCGSAPLLSTRVEALESTTSGSGDNSQLPITPEPQASLGYGAGNSQSSINDTIINETASTMPVAEETATSTPSASSEPAPASDSTTSTSSGQASSPQATPEPEATPTLAPETLSETASSTTP
ncbi:MAG: hypothetical protein HY617_01505, partial [Candidatus Sungbacteria bacterium]|nr:hypothetical protein [Candidatus Sungbacteria bacterium]